MQAAPCVGFRENAGCSGLWVLDPDRGVDGWCVRCDDEWVWLSQFRSLMDNDDSSLQPYKMEYRT